jgi:hypothetical protein
MGDSKYLNFKGKIVICSLEYIARLCQFFKAVSILPSVTKTNTQRICLLKILQLRGEAGLSTPEGLGCGFARLATRIYELRSSGWQIETVYENAIYPDGLLHLRTARYIFRGRCADLHQTQTSFDFGTEAQ